MHKQKRGFTLVELLVVIAIIALLMSILMPALGRTKQQALAVACQSRLHQWGLVFSLYTGKNNGYFHGRPIGTTEAYKRIWIYTYKPYYNDPKMRYCPAAANDNRVGGAYGRWYMGYGDWVGDNEELWVEGENGPPLGSYGFNRHVWNVDNPAFWKRADVKGGAQAPVLCDCQYVNIWPDPGDAPPEYNGDWSGGDTIQSTCIDRHLGYINVLFVDFSVRKVGLKELWTLRWNRTFNTCDHWTLCGNDGDPPDDWPDWLKPYKDY